MRLYDFQQKGIERVSGHENAAFYWDMGLGKTFVGTEMLKRWGKGISIVLCQKSKVSDWEEHIKANMTGNVLVVTSKMSENELVRELVKKNHAEVVICNYELAWRRPVLGNRFSYDCLLLDESSIVQNHKAKVTRFVLSMDARHKVLLSGTPCSGKYENLWSQAQLLGWNISLDAFNSTYINWEKFRVGLATHWRPAKENPYKNVERLKAKFRLCGADFLKTEEVLELPEQVIVPLSCGKTKEYEKFRKGRYIALDKYGNELIGDSIMAWRIGLRKLCTEYNPYKLQAIEDLLSSSNERFIIFYNWNSELKVLMTICSELGKPMSLVNGKEKDLSTYECEDDSVTLVQYQAGAMGLNLQKARRVIYFSLPERSDLFEQSKKRIHRIGQKSTCFYYIPITTGSIEASIYKCLETRRDYTDELFREEMGV